MSAAGSKSTPSAEIEAFFAQPRRTLYLGLAVSLLLLAGLMGLALLLVRLGCGRWAWPPPFLVALLATCWASRGRAGRGGLRVLGFGPRMGRRFSPEVQIGIWAVLLALSLVGALVRCS